MKFKNIKKSQPKSKKKLKSPSNPRINTERFKFSFSKFNSATLVKVHGITLRVFVVFVFILAVIIVGLDFQRNIEEKKTIDFQREKLTKELIFWEDFISKNQNYRDAYFQASILEYRLGNASKAKKYLEKGLILDPNSENGKKLEEFLVNK